MNKPSEPNPNRILLVEDHELLARLTAKMIEGMGYDVTCAASISQARAAEPFDFGLVLTDYSLPDGDVQQLLEHVREHSSAPVLLLTAYAADDVPEHLRNGFGAILSKPVDKDLLRQVLAQHLPVSGR